MSQARYGKLSKYGYVANQKRNDQACFPHLNTDRESHGRKPIRLWVSQAGYGKFGQKGISEACSEPKELMDQRDTVSMGKAHPPRFQSPLLEHSLHQLKKATTCTALPIHIMTALKNYSAKKVQ